MKTLYNKNYQIGIFSLLIIFIFFLQIDNIYPKKPSKISLDLNTIKFKDFGFSPNESLNLKNIGEKVIWVGKIDSIEIEHEENSYTLLIYCSHKYFNNVTLELISTGNFTLKESGDGYFMTNIISEEFTEEVANMMKEMFSKPGTHVLVVGEIQDYISKFDKKYVFLKSLNFYTFIQ